MASPLSLLIGLRFSRGRRRSGMVSLISVISTIGIALGVAVLIVGLSAMNGFERELNNRILKPLSPTVKSSRLTSRGPTGVMPLTKWKRCPALRRLHLTSTLPGW